MLRTHWFLRVAIIATSSLAHGQSVLPVGTPFPIAPGAFPAEAVSTTQPSGFVVVWTTAGEGASDLLGRRFDGAGVAIGSNFVVSDYTTGWQQHPRLCADTDGHFVVTWTDGGSSYGGSDGRDGSGTGVFARRFASDGGPRGSSFAVNTTTQEHQLAPAVACNPTGGFTVVWRNAASVDAAGVIQGTEFDSLGNSISGEFALAEGRGAPAIATNSAGRSAVVWENEDIIGTMIDASTPARADPITFVVNAFTTHLQRRPAVAIGADLGFVVVWEDAGDPDASPAIPSPDGSGSGVFARFVDADGQVKGSQFQVNVRTAGDQLSPSVCTDTDLNSLVVWTEVDLDHALSVRGKLFRPDASPQGGFRAGGELANPVLTSINCGPESVRAILSNLSFNKEFSFVGQVFGYKSGTTVLRDVTSGGMLLFVVFATATIRSLRRGRSASKRETSSFT